MIQNLSVESLLVISAMLCSAPFFIPLLVWTVRKRRLRSCETVIVLDDVYCLKNPGVPASGW